MTGYLGFSFLFALEATFSIDCPSCLDAVVVDALIDYLRYYPYSSYCPYGEHSCYLTFSWKTAHVRSVCLQSFRYGAHCSAYSKQSCGLR